MSEITDKVEIYKDKAGEWRWRMTAANGEIVGASTEGYKNKTECFANAVRVTTLPGKEVSE